MPLLQPSLSDYRNSAEEVSHWFREHDLDYIIYGSFNNPEKIRPGLSDIDIFVHKDTPALLFPIRITEAFGRVKARIDELGIPLQINWSTSGQLKSTVFDIDAPYLTEIRRGLASPHKSKQIEDILNEPR